MANSYINTVPQGREGTGAATIIGPNRALQYSLNQLDKNQNRILAEQQQYQQRQSQQNAQFNKTLMEVADLGTSPMYGNDFAEITNEVVKQGGQLMAQGINPYNPYQNEESRAAVQQWQGEVNKLKQAKAQVDMIYKDRQAQVKRYLDDPDSYDFTDFQKLRDFENENSLEDILEGNTQLPQLGKRVNISEDITKQYGQIYNDTTEQGVDANGNPITTQVRAADTGRITSIVNNEFNSGSKYGQEVNRRLRREFGDEATLDGLLGITDRDELRQVLDAEFRNPSDTNPLVELRANGINARPGTPEYESFLEQAVNEQLKAELILDNAKQEAANALIGRTNTSRKEKFDFTLRNQQLREQSASRAARNSDLSARNSLLSIQMKQAKINGGDSEAESLAEGAVDIDFSEDYGGGEVEGGIKVFSAIPLNTSSISISPANTTDVKTGNKVKQNELRGNITGIGIVAYDEDGKVVQGNTPEELAKNPRVVRFAPQVLVQDSRRQSYSYSPESIPVTSLAKAPQSNVKKAIGVQQRTANELNNQLKKRPATRNRESVSWKNYDKSLGQTLGEQTVSGTSSNTNSGSLDNL